MIKSDAKIIRMDFSNQGTFGRFFAPGLNLFSGELADRNNAPNVSCIPEGFYRCLWTPSSRFHRKMYIIEPVPRRTGIRAHSANFMGDESLGFRRQLNGCIALGERLGWMDGQKALLISASAVRRFESYFAGRTFILEITSHA
jgi:hypothetical protein